MKKVLTIWGNYSSESKEFKHPKSASLMVVNEDDDIFTHMFAFMAKSEDNDEPDEEVTSYGFKENLHIFSIKTLGS